MSDKKIKSSLKCCQSNDSIVSVHEPLDNMNQDQAQPQLPSPTKKTYAMVPVKDPNDKLNNRVLLRAKTQHFVFPQRQRVNLEFNNLTFKSTSINFNKFKLETKTILNGISGNFKPGELSVIMGPSGAGKSTLLNILAGFITRGSTGEVRLNGVVRDQSEKFKKLSAYIPQDEELRLCLTVKEAMTFAANLKLGYSVTQQYKRQQVADILELLLLEDCVHTLTSQLSGGQRKRLAVALELLSNPPILFLDEPTTGLDTTSCNQCIYLFQKLAKDGRSVICTIHQPSALLFEMFDNLYALTAGSCIYQGRSKDVLPYLNNFNLVCPPYHNPADFLMEVAIGEHETDINLLIEAAKEQQLKNKEANSKEKAAITTKNEVFDVSKDYPTTTPAPVLMQFFLLYKRNLLSNKRNWQYLFNRLIAHILIGIIFGYLYQDVGKNANQVLANYVYLYGTMLLNVYTGQMSVTLSFPMEMKVLLREHFNRWYKLSPYLMSVLLIEIPFQLLCTWTYIAISYWLTSQPLDFRAYIFIIFVTIGTLCAQSMGYLIGATTTTKIAVFVGPVMACIFSIFGFCIRYYDTPYIFRWLFFLSYFRAAFHGVVVSIYGFNRADLYCPEIETYCHYTDPSKFLKEMDIVNVDLVSNISLVVCIWIVMNAATFLTLWFKLHKR